MKSTPIAAKMNLIFLPIILHNYEYRNIFYCDEYDKRNSFFFFFFFCSSRIWSTSERIFWSKSCKIPFTWLNVEEIFITVLWSGCRKWRCDVMLKHGINASRDFCRFNQDEMNQEQNWRDEDIICIDIHNRIIVSFLYSIWEFWKDFITKKNRK